MPRIPLPAGYREFDVERVVQSITDYDQWDDWLPDPVYFKDVMEKPAEALRQMRRQLTDSRLTLEFPYTLEIYSGGAMKFRAPVPTLVERVALADVIAGAAAVAQPKLKSDRLDGLQYVPKSDREVFEWTADVFGGAYGRTWQNTQIDAQLVGLPTDWNSDPRSPFGHGTPVFTAVGEGLFDALNQVGTYLVTARVPVRSVAWRDVQSFYPNINRPLLWRLLTTFGVAKDTVRFLADAAQVLAPSGGLPPIDDAWGFLAQASLDPVDRALTRDKILWRRCGDEYFLLSTAAHERAAAVSTLERALSKIGLALNRSKDADLEISLNDILSHKGLIGVARDHWIKPFRLPGSFFLYVLYEASNIEDSKATSYFSSATSFGWPETLRRVLSEEVAAGPHNQVMLLMRAAHQAREADVLALDRDGSPRSAKCQRYRQAVADLTGIPPRLALRLEQAFSAGRVWTCHWLLTLLSDLGRNADPAIELTLKIARDGSVDAVLRAQALLTLAKTASKEQCGPLLNAADPANSPLAERILLVASFYGDKRWRLGLLNGARWSADQRLRDYLGARVT